jgi:hypothetical protein
MSDQKQNTADFLDDFVVTVKKAKSNEDRPLLPELTWLPAVIKQIKKKQLPKSQSIRAHFTFVISSGKYKDQYAWGSVPLHEEITEKADLYRWLCNILGKTELNVEENVRIGDLVGKFVEIMVKNTKVGAKTYQNVTEVKAQEEAEEAAPVEVEKPKQVAKPVATVKIPEKTIVKPTPKKEVVKVELIEEEEAEGADLNIEEETTPTEEISEDDLPF